MWAEQVDGPAGPTLTDSAFTVVGRIGRPVPGMCGRGPTVPLQPRAVLYPDDDHPCPVCCAHWNVPHVWPRRPGRQDPRRDRSRWFVPDDSGWCSNTDCAITDERRDEYRVFRRSMGWDPTEESG